MSTMRTLWLKVTLSGSLLFLCLGAPRCCCGWSLLHFLCVCLSTPLKLALLLLLRLLLLPLLL
jgi:hypothetical protein